MTEEEYGHLYNQLVSILEQHDKQNLVDQVEEYIHKGKVQVVEKVETVKLKEDKGQQKLLWQNTPGTQFQRSSRADFLTVADFTAQERVLLLLDAIITTLDHELNTEEAVLSFFNENLHVDTIIVYSEEEQRETVKFQYGLSRRQQVEEVLPLLQELRKEIIHEPTR